MSNERSRQETPGLLVSATDILAARIARLCGFACAMAMIAMALGITAEIIARNFFSYSFRSVEELSGYLIVAITFLSLAVAVHENALFRVEVLVERFSTRVRRRLELVFFGLFIAFLAIINYQAISLVIGSWHSGYVASTLLATPLYIPQMLIPLGLTATMIVAVVKMLHIYLGVVGTSANDHGADDL